MNDTIKIDAAALAAHVAWIAKGKQRPAVPILGTAQVRITAAGLSLRYTDYDLFRDVVVPCDDGFDSERAVQISPVLLAGLLKGCKGDAAVTVSDDRVTVAVGSRILTAPAAGDVAEFPEWPAFQAQAEPATLDVAALKRGMTSVGTDDTLPMLTHVYFHEGAMVTTDRFRLSVIRYAADGFTALVPSSVLKPFTVGVKGEVTVEHGKLAAMPKPDTHDMRVRVSSGGRSIIARVGAHEFPKYQQLVDSAAEKAALFGELGKAELLAAIGNFAKNDSVQLEIRNDGTMLVQMRNGRAGEVMSEDTIGISISSAQNGTVWPFVARFEAGQLASILKAIQAPALTFNAQDATHPWMAKGSDADYHLVMPVRIAA
jgi:DNA polymerase III sliding clamp (beta) subunit (PCNA family)